MPIHYVNITKKEFFNDYKQLYRFSDLETFLKMVEKRFWYFFNPLYTWKSPTDLVLIKNEFYIKRKKYKLPAIGSLPISSFIGSDYADDCWDVLTSCKPDVRLVVNTKNFVEKILMVIEPKYDIFIGKVNYQSINDFYTLDVDKTELQKEFKEKRIGEQQIKILLKKRKVFSNEDEIRIILAPLREIEKVEGFISIGFGFSNSIYKSVIKSYSLNPEIKDIKADLIKKFVNSKVKIPHIDLNMHSL